MRTQRTLVSLPSLRTLAKFSLRAASPALLVVLLLLPLVVTKAAKHSQETYDRQGGKTKPATQTVKLTPDTLLKNYSSFPRPAVRWLPNSKQLIVTVPEAGGDDQNKTWIELLDVASGNRQRVGEGENPKPSPDGSRIAYIAGEKDNAQLWVMSKDGANAKALTQFSGGLGTTSFYRNFSWSPDSQKIVLGFRPSPVSQEPQREDWESPAVRVIGGKGDIPPDSEIWVVDVATQEAHKVTAGPYIIREIDWFSDGKKLLLNVVGSFEYRTDNVFGEVWAVSAATGKAEVLIKDSGVQSLRPELSPDGTQIGFRYDPSNLVYPYMYNVATVPSQGGRLRQLTDGVFVASGVTWAPSGDGLYFACKEGAFSQICFVDLEGKLKRVTDALRNAMGIAPSPDGKYLAWTTEDPYGKASIRVAHTDGTNEQVLADLTPEVDNLALGEVQAIQWKSRDGLEIAGLLIRPIGFVPNKKYPLFVDLHGGPVGGIYLRGSVLTTSPLEWHLWATKGFVVLVPDYRSSVVYGWDEVLRAREKQDANDRDFDDIMSGVDYVINMGFVDPDKLVVSGHSYGSVLTNWIITHTDRFKVAISKEGAGEMYFAYGTGYRVGGNSIFEWLFKGKPWEVPENYRANSAVEFIKGVKTPTLFVSGDRGIPLYHNEFLFTALSKQGVDAQMLVYKDEGHVIERPENNRDLLMRVLDWVDSHLQ